MEEKKFNIRIKKGYLLCEPIVSGEKVTKSGLIIPDDVKDTEMADSPDHDYRAVIKVANSDFAEVGETVAVTQYSLIDPNAIFRYKGTNYALISENHILAIYE